MKTIEDMREEGTAPEISQCRAVDVGVVNFAECMCKGPNTCEYALPFGYAFLCRHPRIGEIIENTRKSGATLASAG